MNEMTQSSHPEPSTSSRRAFLGWTGKLAAGSALMTAGMPLAHAGENNTIKVALVGCGGRGTGAASNALSVKNGPIKLVALADVFERRVSRSFKSLTGRHGQQVDVPEERQFVSFDGYRKAMDCLDPGDVVRVHRAPFDAKLVRVAACTFYERLRVKLHWDAER